MGMCKAPFAHTKMSALSPRPEGSEDLFAHHSGIAGEGFKSLDVGARVSFEAIRSEKGLQADNVSMD